MMKRCGSFHPLSVNPVIGIFAPAGPILKSDLLSGIRVLRELGFKVQFPSPVKLLARKEYLAGDDENRLSIMTEMMENDEVEVLWALRGGYGAMRLLDSLWDLWKSWPPKPIIGFSDITALHLARLAAVGCPGWHAPMLVQMAISSKSLQLELKRSIVSNNKVQWIFSKREVLKTGSVEGRLVGGNLTVFSHLLSTRHMPELDGVILMLEDVAEQSYRLDRLFTALALNGLWSRVGGVVLGGFTDCGPQKFKTRLFNELIKACKGPVVKGAPFGHQKFNRPWPMGKMASLTVTSSGANLSF